MSKPVLAFIGHPFHNKTRSSDFFIDLLKKDFEVHVFYIEPDPRALMQEIAEAGYNHVVCWQTEFCAPYFLMRGMRVICIPMYDGVAAAPDWYWLAMRQARFIAFSETLHKRLRSLGIESFNFKYYGSPKIQIRQAQFDTLRAFFWQRRPEQGLSYQFARGLVGGQVDLLHIHNAPDTEKPEDWEPDGSCSVSYFSEKGDTYREALERANVFICPRFTEGIGMSMIEAQARGMCVIAHDEPTANEYIIDEVNGLLIDYAKTTSLNRKRDAIQLSLDVESAEKLGRKARELYLRGCEQWLTASQQIPFLVHSAPQADLTAREKSFADSYLAICQYAHRHFSHYLHHLQKLHIDGLLGQEASAMRLREHIRWQVKSVPGATAAWRLTRRLGGLPRAIARQFR